MIYKIPSMSDIKNIKSNGYNVISTFSGCGGSSLGYKMAGYNVLWANEFISAAQKCYEANHLNTFLNKDDIRSITIEQIKEEINNKEIDILDGSPPCASFSMAGSREKSWGKEKKYSDTTQRVDDLFFEYVRLVKGLQPKIFIAENVPGLNIGSAKNILGQDQMDFFNTQEDTILYQLRACGYNVQFRVLNAKYYGVAQARKRLFIVGIRNDLNMIPSYPNKKDIIYDAKSAFYNVVNTDKDILDSTHKDGIVKSYVMQLKEGESGDKYAPSGYFGLQRIWFNKPSPTICQRQGNKGACLIHPKENRELTVPELKRLQGFPDDFILNGSYKQNCERIGRSVPPPLMKELSKHLQIKVLDKYYER